MAADARAQRGRVRARALSEADAREVDAFCDALWLEDGLAKNTLESYALSNLTAKPNMDGSVTVQFGGCTKATPNCLVTPAGWNYIVRMYRPRKEVLDGSWRFPVPTPVN